MFEGGRRRVFKPSPEQQAIVDAARTQNVVVSARPGSGKTATAEDTDDDMLADLGGAALSRKGTLFGRKKVEDVM